MGDDSTSLRFYSHGNTCPEIFINRTISRKQQNEQAAFAEFVRRMGTHGDWLSVDSRPEPEPDLLCIHVDGPVAFELVSLTDSAIAKVQAAGQKAHQDAFYTSTRARRLTALRSYRCSSAAAEAQPVMRTSQSQGSSNPRATMAVCRSATTSIQRQGCPISMNTKSQSKKLRIFSVSRCKIYVDGMILEFQSARLETGGI